MIHPLKMTGYKNNSEQPRRQLQTNPVHRIDHDYSNEI
jgi:hypothetical protein